MIIAQDKEITPSFDVVLPNNVNTPGAILHCFNKEVTDHFLDARFTNASYTCVAIMANGERFFLSINLTKKRL